MCGCLLHTPNCGPAPQTRRAPWLGIKPPTLGSQACTQSTEPTQPGLFLHTSFFMCYCYCCLIQKLFTLLFSLNYTFYFYIMLCRGSLSYLMLWPSVSHILLFCCCWVLFPVSIISVHLFILLKIATLLKTQQFCCIFFLKNHSWS